MRPAQVGLQLRSEWGLFFHFAPGAFNHAAVAPADKSVSKYLRRSFKPKCHLKTQFICVLDANLFDTFFPGYNFGAIGIRLLT
jgi:hypothetical protein